MERKVNIKLKLDGILSEEERAIRETFEEYCWRKITPLSNKWNRDRTFHREIMKNISGMFLEATVTPEKGEKLDEVSLGVLSESMGKKEFPISAFLTMHFAKLLPLVSNVETRMNYLEKYLSGDLVICGAFTEPGCGSNSASIATSARSDGNSYIITGEKAYISSPG
ncbi:short-chain specific acyl-CoA dehydrogenase, partial [mine drainage metagenome]